MRSTLVNRIKHNITGVSERAAGDKARDEHRWLAASKHYASYLKKHPKDADILVQLGNMLKEDGRYESALQAYEAALRIKPNDDDVNLQVGHLMKMMGRTDDAIKYYSRSLSIRSKNNPSLQELIALGAVTSAMSTLRDNDRRAESGQTIFIDFTDLFIYVRHNESLSGIQRVVSNIIIRSQQFLETSKEFSVTAVIPNYHEMVIYAVNVELVRTLIEAVESRKGREAIDKLLHAIEQSKYAIAIGDQMRTGDIFVIAGAFWIYQRYDLLAEMRRTGLSVVVYIHDLIQITNPQYVAIDATLDFRKGIVDILSVCSLVLTNSEFVAGEVRRYMASYLDFSLPVKAVTLATELGYALAENATSSDADIGEILKTKFVLSVSTIEVRKNHSYVIDIWERLINNNVEDVPNLVFVGKWGWQIEALKQKIENSDYLGGRLYILNGISDADLALLYKHCYFTIYPSFAEGWGLPVGESLAFGKLCVATHSSSVPEVGGDLCVYVDPFDVDDGYEKVLTLVTSEDRVKHAESLIASDFKVKTWDAFSGEFFHSLTDTTTKTRVPDINNVLAPGEVAYFGHGVITQSTGGLIYSARMSRTKGWHQLEAWGCWSTKRRATIAIPTPLQPNTPLDLYVMLRAPDLDALADCMIGIGNQQTKADGLGPIPKWFKAPGMVDERSRLVVDFLSGKGFAKHFDGIERYVGIIAVGYSIRDDEASAQRILKRITSQ